MSFDKLNNDMLIKLILENLSFSDTRNLCDSNVTLGERCQRLKIYDRILQRDYPLATLANYNAYEQLNLIERGFETIYYYEKYYYEKYGGEIDFAKTNLSIIEANYFRGNSYYFSIPGLPPPKGTKVYIIGYKIQYEKKKKIIVFPSKQEAIMCFRNRQNNHKCKYFKDEEDMDNIIGEASYSDIKFNELDLYIDFIKNNPQTIDILRKTIYDQHLEDFEEIIEIRKTLITLEDFITFMKDTINTEYLNEIVHILMENLADEYDLIYPFFSYYIENNDYSGENILFLEVKLP